MRSWRKCAVVNRVAPWWKRWSCHLFVFLAFSLDELVSVFCISSVCTSWSSLCWDCNPMRVVPIWRWSSTSYLRRSSRLVNETRPTRPLFEIIGVVVHVITTPVQEGRGEGWGVRNCMLSPHQYALGNSSNLLAGSPYMVNLVYLSKP